MTQDETGAQPSVEKALSQNLDVSFGALTDDERAKLPKVLFPDTHTDTVEVKGRERTLRPTSVKVSRKLNALLSPMMKKVEEAQKSEEDVSVDEDMLKALSDTAVCLAEFYGDDWNDIRDAVKEEELPQVELEALAFVQQNLNGANDFLLQPLRVVVKMLQAREIATVKIESLMSTSITLPS